VSQKKLEVPLFIGLEGYCRSCAVHGSLQRATAPLPEAVVERDPPGIINSPVAELLDCRGYDRSGILRVRDYSSNLHTHSIEQQRKRFG